MPGIAKDQLSIGIEGNIVRLNSKEGASRVYKAAYELPQDIDVASSEARLENGVLTLKLTKQVPVSRVTELTVN
jgi:HSP20 family molecular chaperone IbpA